MYTFIFQIPFIVPFLLNTSIELNMKFLPYQPAWLAFSAYFFYHVYLKVYVYMCICIWYCLFIEEMLYTVSARICGWVTRKKFKESLLKLREISNFFFAKIKSLFFLLSNKCLFCILSAFAKSEKTNIVFSKHSCFYLKLKTKEKGNNKYKRE